MKPVKRRSSRSPSHRRPTKIGPSRDNRRPLEHSLTCLHNPSNASSITTHSAAYSGREAPPSITMEHASLDPFLRRPLSRVDPRSSHGISSRYRVNQSHSGPQTMGLTPTENVRPLYKYDTGKTETSAHLLQRDFARFVTGAGAGPSSNVWSGTTVVPHVRARQNNNSPVFDVMGSTADVDVLGHDTATLKPPVLFPGFEDDLNDFEFDAFVSSLVCIPRVLSDTTKYVEGNGGLFGEQKNVHDIGPQDPSDTAYSFPSLLVRLRRNFHTQPSSTADDRLCSLDQ